MGRAGISCEHIRIFNCGRVCTCCFQRSKLYFYDTKQTINSTPKQHGQEQDNERVTHTQRELGIELSWSLGRVSSLQGLMSIRMLIFMQIFADRFRPGMGGWIGRWRDGVGLCCFWCLCPCLALCLFSCCWRHSLFFIMDTSRWRK